MDGDDQFQTSLYFQAMSSYSTVVAKTAGSLARKISEILPKWAVFNYGTLPFGVWPCHWLVSRQHASQTFRTLDMREKREENPLIQVCSGMAEIDYLAPLTQADWDYSLSPRKIQMMNLMTIVQWRKGHFRAHAKRHPSRQLSLVWYLTGTPWSTFSRTTTSGGKLLHLWCLSAWPFHPLQVVEAEYVSSALFDFTEVKSWIR